jgi:polysaccharide export outer membrane protein
MVLRTLPVLAGLLLAINAPGCAGPGNYVWYQDLPPEDTTGEYVVAAGDIVNVRVLGHDEMATRVRVRPDGRIAVPMIGEVEARGKTPQALRAEIEARLRVYLVAPSVTFNVEESTPVNVTVLGEVTHPGVFPLDPNMRLAQALALGGGVTEFASRDRIFVVRAFPRPERIRFTYEAVSRDAERAASFRLHPGDVVVVE